MKLTLYFSKGICAKFPRLFPIKDVVELTEKAENALRSKSKNVAVRQKETKLNKKDRLTSAIILRRRYINYL